MEPVYCYMIWWVEGNKYVTLDGHGLYFATFQGASKTMKHLYNQERPRQTYEIHRHRLVRDEDKNVC